MTQNPDEDSELDLNGLILPEDGIVDLTDKLTAYMTEIELGRPARHHRAGPRRFPGPVRRYARGPEGSFRIRPDYQEPVGGDAGLPVGAVGGAVAPDSTG